MALLRALELVFAIYFITHIPITMFLDSQAILPKDWYPDRLMNLTEWYVRELKDSYFDNPPIWYKSFVYSEQIFQLPFFFVASYAFVKGSCSWIRIPIIIYSSHVATTVLPMLASYAFEDFSKRTPVGPATTQERLILIGIYCPYFIIPILLLITMLVSDVYKGNTTLTQTAKSAKKKKYY